MPQPTLARQAPQVLIRRSTNIVELRGFYDEVSASFPTDAVVTVTLLDAASAPVANATALPMAHVGGTRFQSTYRATIPPTVDLSGASYTARLVATLAGATREMNIPCTAVDG
jgi:hypothetical protein